MRPCFVGTQNGLILSTDGLGQPLRWDGLASAWEEAGVKPPTAAVTVSGSGAGGIVGTYYAYCRFVDKYGNYSNLSPISASYTAAGSSGSIANATNATPIAVTSAGHGLSTGDIVKISGVGGNTDANGTWTVTVSDTDTFTLDGSSGVTPYNGGGSWQAGIDTISYTGVPVPSEAKVTKKQILRNTDGQTDTFYVDVETTSLATTSFSSTNDDETLAAQTAVAILDEDGNPLANRYTRPPTNFTVAAAHKDRMFLAVDLAYAEGHVEVANGSATVTGIGTAWTTSLAGRKIWLAGADQPYEISAVDASAQTLTLTANYGGASSKLATYTIRSDTGYWKLVQYSESNLPEAWPAINGLTVQEDGDLLTGLMPMGPFVYFLEERHIYRFTYQVYPDKDGAIFLAANRGCLNQRCWTVIDGVAYLLDYEGVYKFGGDESVESVSEPINDLFSTTLSRSPWRINWASRDRFHCAAFPPETTIRWYVSLDGSHYPRHALCYNYREQRWWVEEYPFPIGGSAYGQLQRRPQQYLGVDGGRVLALGASALDGSSSGARGTLSSATALTLTDNTRTFASSLVGLPVVIAAGPGLGQRRIIASVSGGTLTVDRPFRILPDSTSTYQVGGIPWRWKSGWLRIVESEDRAQRRLELTFQPQKEPGLLVLKLYLDFSSDPMDFAYTQSADNANGIGVADGESALVCDLARQYGVAWRRIPGGRELYTDGRRYAAIELQGGGSAVTSRLVALVLDGMVPAMGEQ